MGSACVLPPTKSNRMGHKIDGDMVCFLAGRFGGSFLAG